MTGTGMTRKGWLLVALSVLLSGCLDRRLAIIDPNVTRAIDEPVNNDGTGDVDLLLVIDDSNSMAEEQRILTEQIPLLVQGLTSPPDRDGDGEPDWNAVASLHIAVITTDMGSNGVPTRIGGCSALGGDGTPRTDSACDPSVAPIQTWATGEDAAAFVGRVGCLGQAGVRGCGIEQPLGAAVRSLDHLGPMGFPREEALFAVLVLTDEEDCSIRDPAGFFPGIDAVPAAQRNTYCVDPVGLSQLEPVAHIATALASVRPNGDVVFAAIAGIPVDLAGTAPAAILADPRMQYRHNPGNPGGLDYACTARNADGTDRSLATPGRRIVELAGMVSHGLVRSICEDSFERAITELTARIGGLITKVCLGRALTPDAAGRVNCRVTESLPVGMGCADVVAREAQGLGTDGRALCRIAQAPGGIGSGWFYDITDPACDVIRFTDDAIPPFGARLRFQCVVQLENPAGSTAP